MIDYLPMVSGLRLEYRVERSEGESLVTVETLEVRRAGAEAVARLLRSWRGPEGDGRSEETLERRADGWYRDGALELPAPAAPDFRWARPPREYFVNGLDGAVETPAGRFSSCLRVGYLIAGGDGGSGERFYAPGVGLVFERCADESDPSRTMLLAAEGRP